MRTFLYNQIKILSFAEPTTKTSGTMKKRLFLMFVVATILQHIGIMAPVPDVDSAAIIVRERGVYEQKRVVTVDSVSASKLYSRAMEALSDWTGPDGRSEAGLDYHDRDEGVVTYKGAVYNGSQKLLFGREMPFYTDFTLKVRCRDGRAQVTVTVPSVFAILPDGDRRTWTIREVLEENEANPSRVERAKRKSQRLTTREVVELLLNQMEAALKNDSDDDF